MMGTDLRVNGRGVSRIIVHESDKMGVESKTPPASAQTDPRADPESPELEVGAMGNRSNPNARRGDIAAEFLRIAARDLATATRARIRYMWLARQYGMTNTAIADATGITEKAVRGLLERNADWLGDE